MKEKKKASWLINLEPVVWTAAAALGCQPAGSLLGHWMPPRQALGLLQTHSSPYVGLGQLHPAPPLSNPHPVPDWSPSLWWQLLAGPREAVILYITTNRAAH